MEGRGGRGEVLEGANLEQEGELGVPVGHVECAPGPGLLREAVDDTAEDTQALVDVARLAQPLADGAARLLLLAAREVDEVQAAGEGVVHAAPPAVRAQRRDEHAVRAARLPVHARLADVPILRALLQQPQHVRDCTPPPPASRSRQPHAWGSLSIDAVRMYNTGPF